MTPIARSLHPNPAHTFRRPSTGNGVARSGRHLAAHLTDLAIPIAVQSPPPYAFAAFAVDHATCSAAALPHRYPQLTALKYP